MSRRFSLGLAAWLTVAMAATTSAAVPFSLSFEFQALDLDTGVVYERAAEAVAAPGPGDFWFAYNANLNPHAVVVLESNGAAMAILTGVPFESVTAEDIAGLALSEDPADHNLGFGDTVVIQTSGGSVFKIGHAVETEDSVTIDVEQLL